MNEVLSAESQRHLEIAKCLESIKPFKEELVAQLGAANAVVSELTMAKIDDKKLAELNCKIGERNGYEKAMSILQGFEDELNERRNLSQIRHAGVKRN